MSVTATSVPTGSGPAGSPLDPATALPMLADLGFLASSDLPDRPGPAYLLVALRPTPTLHHYDPERIDYWTSVAGIGAEQTLTRESRLPIRATFSWGLIRIVDRLRVTNEYLSFGGQLVAEEIDGTTVAVFISPAPLLRRGGHSQGWDHGAESVGAFFGRLLVAVDYVPGFEARMAQAGPVARYAAFVADLVARYRVSPELRSSHPELWALIEAEARRLQRDRPVDWAEGSDLLAAMASRA